MEVLSIKMLLAVLFLGFSCGAFFTMLHLLGAPHTPHARTLRIVHRTCGGIAAILYVITAVACITGAAQTGGELSPRAAFHLTFGALFVPFILLKIAIVEKYPELRNRLFTIGTVLFAVVFVIFFTSTAAYLARGGSGASVETALLSEDITLGRQLFVIKCAKCHRLDRPLSARKTPEEWAHTVDHMRQKDRTWLSETETEKITDFLILIGGQTESD
jgi:hypothetical protein